MVKNIESLLTKYTIRMKQLNGNTEITLNCINTQKIFKIFLFNKSINATVITIVQMMEKKIIFEWLESQLILMTISKKIHHIYGEEIQPANPFDSSQLKKIIATNITK